MNTVETRLWRYMFGRKGLQNLVQFFSLVFQHQRCLASVCDVVSNEYVERIKPTFHNHRRSEQAGFTAGRSTTEQIFAIRQIIEKSKEFNKSTYIAFIDFKAAFDSVSRDSLWKILQICGVPHELSVLVRQL